MLIDTCLLFMAIRLISLVNASITYILMSMKLTPVHAYILYVHYFFVIHQIYIYLETL